YKTQLNVDLGEFPMMTYQEAAFRFGSDKPDLRVKLEFTELTEVMKDVDFKVFSTPATTKGGRVVALRVPGGSQGSPEKIPPSPFASRCACRTWPPLQGSHYRGATGRQWRRIPPMRARHAATGRRLVTCRNM
ncbi:hypothetical protein OIO03_25065, partial [Acinetobacter baumannii]|nr:hypothetical protein [Acinetobacter baumannii]MCW1766870.1 hypothetical protein [Acinetobacter baumannii]